MSGFDPVAIIGQGCLLPQCRTPDALWDAVVEQRVLLTRVPDARWRLDRDAFLRAAPGDHSVTPVRSDVGGYVTTPPAELQLDGWNVGPERLRELDPVVQWTVHAAGQALADARLGPRQLAATRAGLIMGNLSYPTVSLARLHEHTVLGALLEEHPPHPLNRFMSGLPAILAAEAFGLNGPAFCLDAACASSIYAVKLACDRLHRGECEVMVAGAVNASDSLFIHAGFATLGALSQTGRSRPFHREADGLVPSEGAAFVVLKRLADAERDGDRIAGVIRGIGLSNDGRAGGFLSPAAAGQVRAIRAAFAGAEGLSPDDVSLVECHATGTAAGDHVEIDSLRATYGDRSDLTITALKANLGHSITTSAAAALLKLLAALRHGVLPPTPNAVPTLPALAAAKYRVLAAPEPWVSPGRNRVAALSAFGMGGNNAHLLLEAWPPARRVQVSGARTGAPEVVIVAAAVRTAALPDRAAFARALIAETEPVTVAPPEQCAVELDPKRLFSPPHDLRHALGQQLLLLETAEAAVAAVRTFDRARTGVFVGMQADPEINRHALRARLDARLGGRGTPAWRQAARAAIAEVMQPPDIVGTMPNIPANRLNHAYDLLGQGFTVSAEEASGTVALELAVRALEAGELDAAVVGAVDLAREGCHLAAVARAVSADAATDATDAAVVLVLKRRADAERDGDTLLARAYLPPPTATEAVRETETSARILPRRLGRAHAADGLLQVAAAALAAKLGAALDAESGLLRPVLRDRARCTATVRTAPFCRPQGGPAVALERVGGGGGADILRWPRVRAFAGADRGELQARLAAGEERGAGAVRLAFVSEGPEEDARALAAARRWLADGGAAPVPAGLQFSPAPLGGDVAFAFTGAAAAYPQMGRELLVGMPDLLDGVAATLRNLEEAGGWIFEPGCPGGGDPFRQLAGTSLLSQAHARLTLDVMKLRPAAALGLSSGETNALFAFGVWDDMDALFAGLRESRLYTQELGGSFRSVAAAWGVSDPGPWENWVVTAPAARVWEALAGEPRVYLTIINSPTNCVIAGEAAGCARVLGRLGSAVAVPLGHDLAVHAPVVKPFAATWRSLHTRPTRRPDGVRFYSAFFGGAYEPTAEAVADALTGQALATVDLPRVIERAWADGVRVFVEHGPRQHVTRAIDETLAGRPHLAVALDVPGRSPLRQAATVAATLWTAGVAIDLSRWTRAPDAKPAGPRLRFPFRKPPIVLPPLESAADAPRVLPRPPELVPALVAWETTAAAQVAEPAIVAWHRAVAAQHQQYLETQARGFAALLHHQATLHAALAALPSASVPGALAVSSTETPAEPRFEGGFVAAPVTAPPRRNLWDVAPPTPPTGPSWTRAQLETLASGKVSEVFGPLFARQDDYAVQVRMPEPPLLLCDRVTGIAGEPGSMGAGIVWTETDVRSDCWYLHCGRMPAGLFIEAGQADLLLISWLGADFLNRGERAYRLLGCELVFRGELPKPGDTLRYRIHVDGHARQGDIRLFFFHYDCWINGEPRISVRHGQAGFFTRDELARSGGVIWSAAEAGYAEPRRVAFGPVCSEKRAFTAVEVGAFAAGDLEACFGAGFEPAAYHSRTPAIAAGRGNLLGAIAAFDPHGGPAERGYLRAVRPFAPNDWFFAGHFKNDPCMPGTLMAEGCLQAMAFYLAATGWTLARDGWRFEPATETAYTFVCRGQATPDSGELVYEMFVDTLAEIDGVPTLVAHVLCTVDGLKAFKCERLTLRLVRDYPMSSLPREALAVDDPRPVARIGDLPLDYASLLACAQGDPVAAFGPTFEPFRHVDRSPRLPSPPYHFCTRVTRVEGEIGSMRPGASVEMCYDLPADAWYFAENPDAVMPFCVLLEAALQPCGWLASYVLDPANAAWRPSYRNLDGVGRLTRDLRPDDGTLTTRVRLVSLAKAGAQIIVRFELECAVRDETVFTGQTSFGFFRPEALADTKGIPASPDEQRRFEAPGNVNRSLATAREFYRERRGVRLPGPRLLRLDRLTGVWPTGGRAGRGYARGEKDVRPGDWVFKAHFYQDPVQPGSIGVESLLLLLRLFALETEQPPVIGAVPEFAAVPDLETEWHYRGQVLVHHQLATADLDVLERRETPDGVVLEAEGRLWADGKKIYHLPRFGVLLRWRQPGQAVAVTSSPAAPDAARFPLNTVAGPVAGPLDLARLRERFQERVGVRGLVLQDLFRGAAAAFVDAVVLADPAGFAALRGRPVLYVANHQVAIESMLFIALADVLGGVPCRAIAKAEHRETWMGTLDRLITAELGRETLLLFDRTKQRDLLDLLGRFAGGEQRPAGSLLAHVEGTRSRRADEPVTQVSSVLLDLALRCNLPVVPVRFVGGLPPEPVERRLEVPVELGRQQYHLGAAIFPEELRRLTLRGRKARVCAAINALGPTPEVRYAGDPGLPAAMAEFRQALARGTIRAATPGNDDDAIAIPALLLAGLARLPDRAPETDAVLAWARAGAAGAMTHPVAQWVQQAVRA